MHVKLTPYYDNHGIQKGFKSSATLPIAPNLQLTLTSGNNLSLEEKPATPHKENKR